MQINPKELLSIIPRNELKELNLSVGAATVITRRHYCSQMTMNNLCSEQCQDCADRIRSAAEKLRGAKKPAGLYVVELRHRAAGAMEAADAQKKAEVKRNRFGEKDDSVDMFEVLLETAS